MRITRSTLGIAIGLLLAADPAAAQERDTAAARLAGTETWRTDFGRRTVPSAEIVSGGVNRDGIPAIDRPRFESAAAASRWLGRRDPVIVVEQGGEVKAYPLAILIWHEIVNDHVGGAPVAVTYCPLCNTALAFDRRFQGRTLDFGVTGRLRFSDLVMYDRQTESWWQQATGEGIVGTHAGRRLTRVPSTILGWSEARSLHPGIRVLSRRTGFDRDYGRNPYVRYDDWGNRPFAGIGSLGRDPRFQMMERMVSIDRGEGWAAPLSRLRERRLAQGELEGLPFVVFWSEGAASAVDDRTTGGGREVGQTAAFDRRVGGRLLTFRFHRGAFHDRQTGSRWDLAGRAVAGPMRGQRLRAVPHENPFWFAWVAFRPETVVWR